MQTTALHRLRGGGDPEPKIASAMAIARKRVRLTVASAAFLAMAVACSESIHFRSFWPELLTVASLGLLLTSLLRDVHDTVKQLEGERD